MPDCTHSTDPEVLRLQEQVAGAARSLRKLDRRLASVARSIPETEGCLASALHSGLECVRSDLLADASETLDVLARLDEEGARVALREAAETAQRIARWGERS